MIRVLVADDSPTARALLVAILESDPLIRVLGEARDGLEAVRLATDLRPDLITMDIHMPVMDGLEATKEIMMQSPTPILVVSSRASQSQIDLSLSAVRSGALMVVPTPESPRSPRFTESAAHLLAMVKAMSQVKVVRRWTPRPERTASPPRSTAAAPIAVVAMAASTGGPAAVQRILADLPREFRVPILVVQHIARGFVGGLAQWLTGSCNLHVKVAEEGEQLRGQTVYLAPDDLHLGVEADGRIMLSAGPSVGGFRPAATFLFRSVAEAFGASAAAVILTGMGRDGVEGLRAIRAANGLVIAQDEATSVVNGMPGEAVAAGVVNVVLPVQAIAPRLVVELDSGKADDASHPCR